MTVKPELALGCHALGRMAVDDETAAATVGAALEAGVTVFDTAPHYGAGRSERRLGDALGGVDASNVRISTKVGRAIVGEGTELDYSYDGAWRSLEGSLRRLGVDRVDVLHAHDPLDVPAALDGEFKALIEMRDQGIVGEVGCGTTRLDLLATYLRAVDLDAVMVAGHLNLLDQGASEELLPLARDGQVDVWVAGVFATGVLAARAATSTYRYQPVTDDVLQRVNEIAAVCERHGVSLPAAALHYPWMYAGVTRLVIGAQRPSDITQAASAWGEDVPTALWDDLDGSGLTPKPSHASSARPQRSRAREA